jgi:hypothetical protein
LSSSRPSGTFCGQSTKSVKTKTSTALQGDPEILAIATVHDALKDLEPSAQTRVIEFVLRKLGLSLDVPKPREATRQDEKPADTAGETNTRTDEPEADLDHGEFAGISPVAQKWMQRNGLQSKPLSAIFSLGGDEIDLVANKVPGKSNRARMHNVFLLTGVAAYLAGGAARFPFDKVKEACLHYDAYDRTNFSNYVKKFASEFSGSAETGYTLTARGLNNAVTLIREMTGKKESE